MAGNQGIQIKFDETKAKEDVRKIIADAKSQLDNANLHADIKFDSGQLNTFVEQMVKLNQVFDKMDLSKFNQIGNITKNNKEVIDKAGVSLKSYKEIMDELGKSQLKVLDKKISPDTDGIDKLNIKVRTATGEIQKLQYAYESANRVVGEKVEEGSFYKLVSKNIVNGQQIKDLETYKTKLIDIRNALKESGDVSFSKKESAELDKMINKLAQYVSLLNKGKEVKNLDIDGVGSYVNKTVSNYDNLIRVHEQEIKNLEEEIKLQKELELTQRNAQASLDKLKNYATKNKLTDNGEFQAYLSKLQSTINSMDKTNFGNLKKEFQTTSNEAKAFGDTIVANNKKIQQGTTHVKTLGSAFKGALDNMLLYATSGGILYGMFDQIRKAVDYIKELDTVQSNIIMITQRSRESVQGLTKDITELAKTQHIDYTEALKGSEELLRAGYSDKDSLSIIKSVNLASRISGETPEEISKQAIAIKNAYDMEAEGINGLSGAFDKMTKVDNTSSTSLGEMSTSLGRVSASAKEVNVDFDTILAYVATVSDVTRKSASTIGENFRTIFGRYGNVKGGKFLPRYTVMYN